MPKYTKPRKTWIEGLDRHFQKKLIRSIENESNSLSPLFMHGIHYRFIDRIGTGNCKFRRRGGDLQREGGCS
ncbi:hypothetical protein GCM10027217_26090 [Pseudomaricurvus hydrocarbonicus]